MSHRNPVVLLCITATTLQASTAYADIVISEVMANTSSGFNDTDEYIELCNAGSDDYDVAGHVINDGDDSDTIVAWSQWTDDDGGSLNSIDGGSDLVVDSTIVPVGGCALILDPDYTDGTGLQPYEIESGTIILTVASGTAIGGAPGLGATDPITLYGTTGTTDSDVLSTYGTPIASDVPDERDDDGADAIPMDPADGRSASRIDLAGADEESNWMESAPSPGFRAFAGTFEVAADGSTDYLTIASAIRAAAAGSEILVHPGTYEEDVVFTEGIAIRSVDGASSTFITGSVTIDSVGGAPVLSGFTISGDITVWSVDSEVNDNIIDGGTLTWHYANGAILNNQFIGGSTGIALDYYASPEIAENQFSGQTDEGILCRIGSAPHVWGNEFSAMDGYAISCSSEPLIEANTITDCNIGVGVTGEALVTGNEISGCAQAIESYDCNAEISGNYLADNDTGVFLSDSAGTVHTNLLVDNATGVLVSGGITDFLYNEVSETPAVLHNTIVGSTANGVLVEDGTGDMVEKSEAHLVAGNLVTDGESGISVLIDDAQVLYNNASGNTSDYLVESTGDEELDASNISADPLYADAENGDYSLLVDSPCIDAGWDGELGDTDYAGVDRVIDGDGDEVAIADIGAFEFDGYCPDADGDGYQDDCGQEGDVDCDDTNADVNPGATEVWYDGIDQDCDGNDDDQDGDGFAEADDCDDTDASLTDNCDEGGVVDGEDDTGKDDSTGCGCSSTSNTSNTLPWLAMVGLIGFVRRRRIA